MGKVQLKRGNKANLPILDLGEPALCLDTNEFYIGNTVGNVKIITQADIVNGDSQTEVGKALDAIQANPTISGTLANKVEFKADKAISISLTLLATGWVGDVAPYTQTLTVTGLTTVENGVIGVAQGLSITQRTSAKDAILNILEQYDDTLVIVADGIKPTIDIPITLVTMG